VLHTDRAANAVVVGPREALAIRRVEADGALYVPAEQVHVKLRHRSAPVPARVSAANGGLVLALDEPAYAVAPGQVAAVYDGDAIVGAGVITRVS
jgi:tRNA-specific 2-thiouridylase